MKQLLLILILVVSLSSCETSSPKEIAKAEIEEIFEKVRSSYNFGDLPGIMEHFHPNFLHNGDDYQVEEVVWELRRNQYPTLDFDDLYIDLNGDFASVAFTLYLGDEEFTEPSTEKGDLSYFYKTFDGWKICGNEFVEQF
ncbi:MAG: nuclear transport factor 2 family protein [Candidatus Cloacimonadales bacterium]|nr:nuclear transport factor 2 family protein [Candidatus Cloacimonadales bacterium]